MKKIAFSFLLLLALLGVLKFLTFSTDPTDEQYKKDFKEKYQVYAIEIPKDLNFASEPVPLSDYEVYERADKEFLSNVYFQSNTTLLIKRAHRWLPMIAEMLKANGIPEDFKYIPLIESGLTNVISPREAAGYWQIVPATAKQYGLQVDENIDERYNVVKATQAACKIFKETYKELNNWTLVAAAYNMGMGGVQKQLARQKVDNYYDLILNQETSRYLFRILAVKEIYSHPEKYGFKIRKKDKYTYIPTNKITIDSSISDLATFAIANGYNYKVLKTFNPWLRDISLINTEKKQYSIEFPKDEYKTMSPYFEIEEVDEEEIELLDSALKQ